MNTSEKTNKSVTSTPDRKPSLGFGLSSISFSPINGNSEYAADETKPRVGGEDNRPDNCADVYGGVGDADGVNLLNDISQEEIKLLSGAATRRHSTSTNTAPSSGRSKANRSPPALAVPSSFTKYLSERLKDWMISTEG